MSKTTRKRYSAEFKAKVALEAIRGELTISQLGAKHGVHQTMINAWKKQAMENLSTVLKVSRRPARRARRTSRSCTQRSASWSWSAIF